MWKDRAILLFGGIGGLTGVAAGAALDHLYPSQMDHAVETSLRYHQLYAVVITALGLALCFGNLTGMARKLLGLSALLFILGIVTFSGSLYLGSLTGIRALFGGTPVGGILLMAGWLALALTAVKARQA
jgi:uncharacterized membrane protein YgdD (TMEM256/DUF423 family)